VEVRCLAFSPNNQILAVGYEEHREGSAWHGGILFLDATSGKVLYNHNARIASVRGEENKAEALKAWHRLMAADKPQPRAEVPTVAEVLEGFLADAEARVSEDTLEFYKRFLEPFSKQHGQKKADTLTCTLAEAFSRKPTWSSSTRNDCLGTLATAFRWAERARLIDRTPLQGLRLPPKESAGAEAVISEADYRVMIKNTTGDFQALLRFLWLTGCRPSEATSLTVEAVDWASACIVKRKHKTAHKGKVRVIYLSEEALAVLTAQREKHGQGLLFRTRTNRAWHKKTLAHRMWRLQKKLGIKATAYGMRHTFATDALANGVPDAQVAALLGHSGTTMLHRHYSHLTAQSQALREALGRVR
jgi:integrase